MSYDLMVFEPTAAPRERQAFLDWFDGQAEWSEDHGYDDPKVSSPALQAWFAAVITTFPPMNGPYARATDSQHEDSMTADYCVGRDVIYVAFSWSRAQQAYDLVRSLAARTGIGFYDVSSSLGEVWLPDGRGGMVLQHRDESAARVQDRRAALAAWVAGGPGTPEAWSEPDRPDPPREELATNLGRILARRAGLAEEEAAVWIGEALACVLGDPGGAAAAGRPQLRAALLPYNAKAEGLRALPIGDGGTLLYPGPSSQRSELTGHVLSSDGASAAFALTIESLERGLRTAGYREPRKLAEAALGAAATASLGQQAEFIDGKLIEFRTVAKGAAASPNEIGLAEARAIDPSFNPGEECGFSSDWNEWLYPLLDWLFTRRR